MDGYVTRTLEAIARVQGQFKSLGLKSWTILLSQLDETKRILDGLNPILEGHKPVHRELYRAVIHTEASTIEWWNRGMYKDEPVLAKWREHFIEILFDVRWWTMVTALQAGEKFVGSEIYGNMFYIKRKGWLSPVTSQSHLISHYERHLPSYGFEGWSQEPGSSYVNEILQWKLESGNILGENEHRAHMALVAIRNADFPVFVMEGTLLASYVEDSTSPLIEEEIILDLTRDVLGVSRAGSWVIRTKCQGVDCALKRVDDDDSEQPVIARLSHPHIVPLMHYWRKDRGLFLVMELMEGDLTDLLARHRRANQSLLPLPVAVDIMLQTAKGMLYLHDLDITYPHLNCSNVLFRKSDTLQDGYIEYTIKLSGGGYSVKDDSSGRKTHDVHRFGSFCLEVLTGRQQCEDSLGIVADIRPSVPDAIPPILRFCIASCFEANLKFGFEQVVTILLLAQLQVLKSQRNEAFLSFGSEDHESMQPSQPDFSLTSTADADFEKYRVLQLYPEPDVSDSASNLSATIIFFHGFAKSPDEWKSTWMTRNHEHLWPKVWLPKDLPGNVRILSLSYDTDASGESQEVGAIEIGKNVLRQLVLSSRWNLADPEVKVILIGHSFGGLIIKSLVVEAHNQAYLSGKAKMGEPLVIKCPSFLENLKGIVFYSVPGSASKDDQFEQYIVKLNQTGVLQRSSLLQGLLKEKRSFNQQMLSLGSQFEENVPEKTQILGFIEGKGMRKIREKQVVVSESSARAQLQKADFIILEEDNHFEVCRPVSTDHKGYKILVEHFLKGVVKIGGLLGSLNVDAERERYREFEDAPHVLRNQEKNYEAEYLPKTEFLSRSYEVAQVDLHTVFSTDASLEPNLERELAVWPSDNKEVLSDAIVPSVSQLIKIWKSYTWLIIACNLFRSTINIQKSKVDGFKGLSKSREIYRKKKRSAESNKHTCEIRISKNLKDGKYLKEKVWLGTYATPAQSGRAFDVGMFFLCTKKEKSFYDPNSEVILSAFREQLQALPLGELVETVKKMAKYYGKNGSLPQSLDDLGNPPLVRKQADLDKVEFLDPIPGSSGLRSGLRSEARAAAKAPSSRDTQDLIEIIPNSSASHKLPSDDMDITSHDAGWELKEEPELTRKPSKVPRTGFDSSPSRQSLIVYTRNSRNRGLVTTH